MIGADAFTPGHVVTGISVQQALAMIAAAPRSIRAEDLTVWVRGKTGNTHLQVESFTIEGYTPGRTIKSFHIAFKSDMWGWVSIHDPFLARLSLGNGNIIQFTLVAMELDAVFSETDDMVGFVGEFEVNAPSTLLLQTPTQFALSSPDPTPVPAPKRAAPARAFVFGKKKRA